MKILSLSTNELNISTNELYCFGIIDIMTPYNTAKKIEHLWKSIKYDKNKISATNPDFYAERFLQFLVDSIKINSPES